MSDNEGFTPQELAVLAQVAAAVRSARQAAGLTQQAVATNASLQRSYVVVSRRAVATCRC